MRMPSASSARSRPPSERYDRARSFTRWHGPPGGGREVTDAIAVLVTGAGGVYGEATIGNLRRSDLALRIVGADTRWQAPGVLVSDVPVTLPLVRDPAFATKLEEIVKREGVKIVFVCSGTEIKALAPRRDELERATGATFILPTTEL